MTTMKISGEGISHNGLRAIKERRGLHDAANAISCLHDVLLAVARDRVTSAEVRDFLWDNDLATAKYIGGVVKFEEPEV